MLPIAEAVIFSKGGRVLWRRQSAVQKGDPVNALIQRVLLEEKGVRQSWEVDSYRVEWRLVNEKDVVIACVSAKSMEFMAADLLEAMKKSFLQVGSFDDARFNNIEKELESRQLLMAKKKAQAQTSSSSSRGAAAKKQQEGPVVVPPENNKKETSTTNGTNGTTSKKKKRDWGASTKKKISAEEMEKLDYSQNKQENADDAATARYMPDENEVAAWDEDEEEVDIAVSSDESSSEKKESWFSLLSGSSTLTEEAVGGVMEELRTSLISKNVASEIATDITASVSRQLVGKKVDRFQRAKTLVKDALVSSVERVLTPRTSTDLLAAVLRRKAESTELTKKRPFVVVFVGINGVGKSTTLSKVAYYLKAHEISVLVAACDTFRSGAVEQLRSHAKALDVELFERGYLKDPSDVAKAAIDHAAKQNVDVVLVDTAGRMQNNAALMKQLARLLAVNDPDLTLFVGEALVGNDGIDQLTMFDRALKKDNPKAKSVDGLVLTKFDCIDDKVGAVLSMTYKTGLPVAFVGVGQKYTHLKKLSVNNVLNALFKR